MSKFQKVTPKYQSKYTDFQSFGKGFQKKQTVPYSQQYEKDPYNAHQNFLYKRAMFGLKIYSQEDVKALTHTKRKSIQKTYRKTQKELNIMKQEKQSNMINKIFSMFHKSSLALQIADACSQTDPDYICRTSFKELSITKDQIVERLVSKKLLPANFVSLNK